VITGGSAKETVFPFLCIKKHLGYSISEMLYFIA